MPRAPLDQFSPTASDENRTFSIFSVVTVIAAIGIIVGSWAPFQIKTNELAKVWQAFVQNGFSSGFSRSDIVVNFWLGFPMAIGLCGLLQIHTGNISRRLFQGVLILLAQACVSFIAELGQGWLEARVTSLSDFLYQIAGAFAATVIWQWGGPRFESNLNLVFTNSIHRSEWTRLDAILSFIAAGIMVWTVMPLDVIVSPAGLMKEAVKTELVPFTHFEASVWENIYQWAASVLLAIPLGLWLSRWLARRLSGKLSLISVTLVAIGVGVLPELAQFPIDSRVASATDALFGALGALTGILIGSQFGSTRFEVARTSVQGLMRAPGFWFALATFQALIICLVGWMPFDFSPDTSDVADRLKLLLSNPFSGYRGSDLLNVLTFFRQAVLAAVLGIFLGLGVRALRLSSPYVILCSVIALSFTLVFAVGVELGQLVENSRKGEALGVLIRFGGAIIGWVVAVTFSKQSDSNE